MVRFMVRRTNGSKTVGQVCAFAAAGTRKPQMRMTVAPASAPRRKWLYMGPRWRDRQVKNQHHATGRERAPRRVQGLCRTAECAFDIFNSVNARRGTHCAGDY